MRERWKWLWPTLKVVLTVAILVAVGRQFYRDLHRPDLWQRSLHPGWLLLAAALYPLGLGFSAFYWQRLLRLEGQRPSAWAAVRAYYIGHLGKYLPGKAWALLLRAGLVRSQGVRLGVAAITSTYEVLTTMAAGMLLALVLFALLAPDTSAGLDWAVLEQLYTQQVAPEVVLDRQVLVLLALVLLAPLGVAIAPPVFNRLLHRLARPFRRQDSAPLPRLSGRALLEGLALTPAGWLLLGVSLWAVLQAVMPEPLPWRWDTMGLLAAYLATAYVAGFLIIVVPGGLGVREFLLTLFLVPLLIQQSTGSAEDARASAVLAVLVLRLVWTVAEVLLAGVLYLLPGRSLRETAIEPEGKDET
jgi:uncharacterized membrane protein YbhN (UPF0104 family)